MDDADSGASFSGRCTTSNVIDCLQGPKAVNDVRSRASARKTGADICSVGFMAPISVGDFWSVCQGLKPIKSYAASKVP